MPHLRELNKANAAERMATKFGHSDNLITLSLSLSLSLSQVLTYNNIYIIKTRGHPRKYTAFLAIGQGRPHCFFIPIRIT